MPSRIECVQGDLTLECTDAIVNAANEAMRGGGGVDGAIHRAAGPGLLEECIREHPHGCPTGEARLTAGHRLAARHVIHTVGPIWHGGDHGEPELLAACHRNSIELAAAHGLTTLAFPAISCGIYGYPHDQAAEIAMESVRVSLAQHAGIQLVRFVLFSPALLEVFRAAADRG